MYIHTRSHKFHNVANGQMPYNFVFIIGKVNFNFIILIIIIYTGIFNVNVDWPPNAEIFYYFYLL